MIHRLRAQLKKAIDCGVRPGLRMGLAKKIRVTNVLCLITFAVTALHVFVLGFEGLTALAILLVPIAAYYLGLLLLNQRGFYRLSRIGYIVIFNISVMFFVFALGTSWDVQLLFLPMVSLPIILFELRDWRCLTPAVLLPIVLYLTLTHLDLVPMAPINAEMGGFLDFSVLSVVFLILIASSLYMQYATERAEFELKRALIKGELELARTHQILDAIPSMVILKGKHSRLLWGNRAFREFYGTTNEALAAFREEFHVEPDLMEKYARDDLEVLESLKIKVVGEEQAVRHDGEVCWFNTIKAPLIDEFGKAQMLVAICKDITKQRESERIIREQRMQMESSAKLSSLGQMAAGIAHEINNPLAIIMGKTYNLQRLVQICPEKVDVIEQFATDIVTTVQRIATIVRGLLTFARNGDTDDFEEASPAQIVENTMTLCAARIRNRGIKLEVVGVLDGLALACRPTQISQVLLNLLSNAADAIEGSASPWIELKVEGWRDGIRITVADSGSGISEASRTRIFEPFYTTKNLGKGTGLGLSISKGIIDTHHGTIELDATSPNTKFVIWLPSLQRAA